MKFRYSFINGESYTAVCSDTVWLGCLKGVCSFRWYFQTKVCSSGPCHLDPADPQTGQGGCHSHGPDCLSVCQCANLQPATPLSRPALPASNSRVWRCQQHAPLKTNQPQSLIKHPEVMTSSPFQPSLPVPTALPPAMPTWWPTQAQTHKRKNSSKQGNGLFWAHRTEKTICMPTLCFSSPDTAGGIWKSVVCE